MPRNNNIKKTLLIGSGPIIIGQAAEFDYAGTQALRVLKAAGIEVVLVNSNPATIMTDREMADAVYLEPLTLETMKRIIKKEKPDSILSGFGGQTGLTLCMQLAKSGFLEENNVTLLGSSPDTIDMAEDRKLFKETMQRIGEPVVPSVVTQEIEGALEFADEIGYPVIVRPAFTLGGSGGGIAYTKEELKETAENGLAMSPIHQILVERCIAGWKEIEFEVMRDSNDNTIAVCSMENFDPVGIHTGDSIVVAPALTLADKEFQMLRSAALKMIRALGIEGGCNCQFALNPDSFEYAIIEVNPRVSRSSALASKATGYPIAKVAAKIAIGYTLDEIHNDITGNTYAAFEPTLDYIALKFPKWPFDKFVYAKRELGTQMKATGEVMSISDNFEAALLKAVRGAEIGTEFLHLDKLRKISDETLLKSIVHATDERLFFLYELLYRGFTVEQIHELTKIDLFFLHKLLNIVKFEHVLEKESLTEEIYTEGKRIGFTDATMEKISQKKIPFTASPYYRMVDTCAAEFPAHTPYFYCVYRKACGGTKNEAQEFIDRSIKERVVVFGSGPIRIGQGIEFDYACVHCVWSLRNMGYEVIVINNNPETVSTDFDIADRLYFEPLNKEDVLHILEIEKPIGVFVAFGGQTAIKLTAAMKEHGYRILGTSADNIDAAEDREKFDALLETLNIKRPKGFTVRNDKEALAAANEVGYPVLMRPSYVLGGQNMIIAFEDADIIEYMDIILKQNPDNIVLIDKYINGKEIEVDAICDGEDILLPGIMEHVERTGIHSGDSIAIYPAPHIDDEMAGRIMEETAKLSKALDIRGLMNVQYIVAEDQIYIIEVNPRASRTIPYLSKVTGVPMCDLATKTSMGMKLKDLGFGTGLYKIPPYTCVKVPVFSFEKLTDVDTQLGPEMKSTGEVLGIGKNLREALYKGLIAAGYHMYKTGGVFISVKKSDKGEIAPIAQKYADMGFKIYATEGNARVLRVAGLAAEEVDKIHEGKNNAMKLIESGQIQYIISTSAKGRNSARDSVKLRREACRLGIICLTSLDTANALAESLMSGYCETNTELVDCNRFRTEKTKYDFVKMQGCGNDTIIFDCFKQKPESPESMTTMLTDRHYGIGGDGIVFIESSEACDAKISMFNLDGSEGRMCGNAIRLVAKYLVDHRYVDKEVVSIDTLSGVKNVRIYKQHGLVYKASVSMGKVVFEPDKIPVKWAGTKVLNETLTIEKKDYRITCLSVGNPHCVVFMNDVSDLDLLSIGPEFENNPVFPERINTEFVKIIDETTIKMRVWERGNGETISCGTGACAAAVAAIENGYCRKNENIRVLLKGGELTIRYTDEGEVFLTGNAKLIYEGRIEL